jgi:hypothetical protein
MVPSSTDEETDRVRYGRSGLGALVTLAVVLPAAGAWGHAAGELPRARLSSEGQQIVVEWTAPEDDAADVGVAVGLLTEDAVVAFLGGPASGLPTEEEVRALTRSEELRAYLLDNVQVHQDGHACAAEVDPGEDFLVDGARFVFTCPEEVEEAHVRVTMLHDRDELYATYSVDGTSQYAVHTSKQPEHPWDFTLAAAERGSSEPALFAGGLAAVAALAGAVWFLGPRPGRRGQED